MVVTEGFYVEVRTDSGGLQNPFRKMETPVMWKTPNSVDSSLHDSDYVEEKERPYSNF